MKRIISCCILFLAVLFFSGAGTSLEKAKNYYFPYKNFFDETFYLYVNQNDTTDFNCWSMQTGIVDKDTLFSTIIYDKENRLTESITEKITSTGSEMIAYRILTDNGNRKIPEYDECSVVENQVYKWEVAPMDAYKWSVKYISNGTHVDFSKTRKFSGTSSVIKSGKNEYKCVLYNDNFQMIFNAQNAGAKPIAYSQESYYGLNTGLVRYKLMLPDNTVKDYLLKKITKVKPY